MSGSKPVLFYSKFCRHSGDAVRAISARNLGGSIVMACVDGNTQRLPPWVDRVPLIFTHDRRVLSDESLLMYVASFSPTRALATSSSSAAGPGGIPGGDEPMAAESCNGACFTSFQTGDEESTANAGAGGSPYLSIRNDGLDDFPRIVTPPDDSLRSTSSSSTGGGGGAPSYQPFQQQQQPPQQQQQQQQQHYQTQQYQTQQYQQQQQPSYEQQLQPSYEQPHQQQQQQPQTFQYQQQPQPYQMQQYQQQPSYEQQHQPSFEQQQQQQQPTFQYNPNQFKPPPQPPGAVPGRGMVATVGGGAGGDRRGL